MIVFNAGVPRSGTIFVNAIIRHLSDDPVVQTNPHGSELLPTIRRLVSEGWNRSGTAIVHTHCWDDATSAIVLNQSGITGFLNYRDPRDVCVSYMQLHDMPFEEAASTILQYFSMFEEAGADTGWPLLRYEELVENPGQFVALIAAALTREPGEEAIDAILELASSERHRAIMQQVRNGQSPDITRRRNTYRTLSEDPGTLINDRHIQSGEFGRWRKELPPAGQQFLNQAFHGLIAAYGYELG